MGQFIVLDLEWNQSSHGKDGSMDRLPFEIIEIGAVKLNASLQIISEFHRLIKPRVYHQMHFKISEVTHMSMERLETEGKRFEEVMDEFLIWCGSDYRFCTWGTMDLTELQRNMVYYGLEIPFKKPLLYYDLQKIYSLIKGDKQKESLDTAVVEQGVLEERPFHRALDDAYYTGRVMGSMDFYSMVEYVSVDYYRLPESEEEEIYLEFPDYSKFVSKCYETKEDALLQKQITDVVCYQCHRTLRKKIRWFSPNQKFYFCLATCPEHGYMKGKIRVKKTEDNSVFIVKTLKLVGEEGAGLIAFKKEECKKKRGERNKAKKEAKKNNEKKLED
ncbi:MAG: 3'-5' exonuclease [Clostridium sp.]